MKSVVTYPPIGAIELCTRKNVLRTTFSVSARRVRITTSPLLVKTIFPLSEERIEWIMAARRKIQEKYVPHPLLPTTEIDTCFFKIRFAAYKTIVGNKSYLKKTGIDFCCRQSSCRQQTICLPKRGGCNERVLRT